MTNNKTLTDLPKLVDLKSAKGRLQQAAASLFQTKGYSQTTVRDIAALIGIQSGSIFHHFKSKEQILQSVMTDSILRVMTSMTQALATTNDPYEQIHQLIRCELNAIHREDLSGFRLLISEWRSLSESNQEKILALRGDYELLWQQVLARANSSGLVSVEAFYLRGFIRGALIETANWYSLSGDVSLDELAAKIMITFIPR